MKEQRLQQVVNIAFIAMFMTAIWLPNLDSVFGIAPQWANTEQRNLEKMPPLRPNLRSLAGFQRQFMKYFVDNFGFRRLLIRWNTLFKLDVLRVRQFPKVLVGDDGWLYLVKDDKGNNALDYYRNVMLFAGEDEIAEWARPLVRLERYCADRNIAFLVAFVPMKPRIYPEHMPARYEPVRERSRLDQMTEYLRRKTRVRFIDLGGPLLDAKKVRPVFYKLDVHWNYYGGYVSYLAMARELGGILPNFRPIPRDRYDLTEAKVYEGDLVKMLGVMGRYEDVAYAMPARFPTRAKRVAPSYTYAGSRFTECYETGDASLPRLVVFHDSFFNYNKYFMAENASRMACFQGYGRVDLSAIEREKPDAVVYQIAESFLQVTPAYVTISGGPGGG